MSFDPKAYREGHLTPVYFGSALNNFGVRELLRGIAELALAPRPQPALGQVWLSSPEFQHYAAAFAALPRTRATVLNTAATLKGLCRNAA